jgi:hypothetical protein
MNKAQRIAELEEQVRGLLAQKRELEAKVEELTPHKIYFATTNEWFWREVLDGSGRKHQRDRGSHWEVS